MDLKFGIVEDINDPQEAGRVRVRVFGVHSEKLAEVPTDLLPWAQCMVSTFDASTGGIGKSPTGIVVGQMVVVTFIDSLMQDPFVLGAVNGINAKNVLEILGSKVTRGNTTYGFQQPIDESYIGKPDTNFQARADEINPIHQTRLDTQKTGVTAWNESWDEPASTMNASQYPNSKVQETTSGHLQEFYDTEGNERILLWHKSGTLVEMSNEYKLAKVEGSDYEIVKDNKNISIGGNLNLTVVGNTNIQVDGNVEAKVSGTATMDIGGKTEITCPEIELGTDSSEPMVMGDKLADWIANELKVQYDTHTHTGNLGAPTSPPMMPLEPGTAASGGPVYSTQNKTQK